MLSTIKLNWCLLVWHGGSHLIIKPAKSLKQAYYKARVPMK